MEERRWKVYVHENKANGKRYGGITGKRYVKKRWSRGNGYKNNLYFYRAIQKYGWYEGFYHYIIADNLTKEEAYRMEIDFIRLWGLSDKNNGYNLSSGGEGGSGIKRFGEDNSFYGKKHTDATKKIMRMNHADFSKGNHPMAQKVICLTTMEVFDCMSDAADKYNLNSSDIGYCCRGKFHYIGVIKETNEKLVWRYYDENTDYNKIRDIEIAKAYDYSRQEVKIICLTNGEVFKSIKDAANFYAISRSSINNCCLGRYSRCKLRDKTYAKWMYYKEYIDISNKELAGMFN